MDYNEIIKDFRSVLLKGSISELLNRKFYDHWGVETLKVLRERRFSVIIDGGLNVGTIDRLVLGVKKGVVQYAEIIDFKSDFDPSKKLSSHSIQLVYYKEAIRTIYTLPDSAVSGKLVYVETGAVKTV